MEQEDRSQAMERLEVVEEALSRPRTSEQHFNAVVPKNPSEEASFFIGGGGADADGDRPVSQWKREFVRKMNDMANQEAAKEAAAANHEARSEAGGGGGETTTMGMTYGGGHERQCSVHSRAKVTRLQLDGFISHHQQ